MNNADYLVITPPTVFVVRCSISGSKLNSFPQCWRWQENICTVCTVLYVLHPMWNQGMEQKTNTPVKRNFTTDLAHDELKSQQQKKWIDSSMIQSTGGWMWEVLWLLAASRCICVWMWSWAGSKLKCFGFSSNYRLQKNSAHCMWPSTVFSAWLRDPSHLTNVLNSSSWINGNTDADPSRPVRLFQVPFLSFTVNHLLTQRNCIVISHLGSICIVLTPFPLLPRGRQHPYRECEVGLQRQSPSQGGFPG